MLNVHNLTKHFDSNKAVNNVSFTINTGEIFSLIGPNSSGKSTIVKSITGLLQPTSGTITVNNVDITKKPEAAKNLIGYIPDEPSIWPYMTGEEFVLFTEALYNIPEALRNKSLPELLSTFNLTGTENRYFEEYSRGNRQKFSIIAALSHKPSLLVIDEPIVGLDPTGAEIAKKLFIKHAEHGGSVLLVTHTLQVAEEISHRIGILKNGDLIAVGTMDELRAQASLPNDAHLDAIYKNLA
jgi:ABC-2 type transport system ATP-binding protein